MMQLVFLCPQSSSIGVLQTYYQVKLTSQENHANFLLYYDGPIGCHLGGSQDSLIFRFDFVSGLSAQKLPTNRVCKQNYRFYFNSQHGLQSAMESKIQVIFFTVAIIITFVNIRDRFFKKRVIIST